VILPEGDQFAIHNCDNLHPTLGLPSLPDASVDAVVTDPPAGIEFMGKAWDTDKGGRDQWIAWLASVMRECLRVLKPGGHALVWALPRTSHWTATAVEDAGFEIRDVVVHLNGQGFPKSLDVFKALTKGCSCGAFAEAEARVRNLRDGVHAEVPDRAVKGEAVQPRVLRRVASENAVGAHEVDRADRQAGVDGFEPSLIRGEDGRRAEPGMEGRRDAQAPQGKLRGRALRPVPSAACVDVESGRLRDGASPRDGAAPWSDTDEDGGRPSSGPQPVEQLARQLAVVCDKWGAQACGGCRAAVSRSGWGTALKPAAEHWILARKPLDGTVANCVIKHGTGALNIDGCRIGTGKDKIGGGCAGVSALHEGGITRRTPVDFSKGRWPANVTLDEDAAAALDLQAGKLTSGAPGRRRANHASVAYGKGIGFAGQMQGGYADSGGASRFFYVAKASRAEKDAGLDHLPVNSGGEATGRKDGAAGLASPRAGAGRTGTARNTHPTVKSVALMRWLVRLITPPGGLVLDPFTGSGSTGVAALAEGCRFLGIEREAAYADLAAARLGLIEP
jgi:site-specific DNA-methyltransferase (adenine-specific)